MNDSKNLILAVVLSALVLLGWSWAANKYLPTANPPATKVVNGKQQPVAPPAPSQQASPSTPKETQTLSAALTSAPRVAIRTPTLLGSINLRGAQIDDLQLLTQKQTIAANSPPVRLLSPLGAAGAYAASFGWTAQGGQAPAMDTVWTSDSTSLTPGHPVTLTTQTADGSRYQIQIAVDDGYLFTIQQSVTNLSGKPINVRPMGLVSRATQSADKSMYTNHVGPIGVFNGKVDYSVNWKDIDQGTPENFDNSGWLGFTDKYWLTALVPQGGAASEFRRAANGGYQADYALAPMSVGAGQTVNTSARFFAGVKEKKLLDRYEHAGIPLLSYAIDWGYFWFFARPIFDLLVILFHTVGNFGLAIICLTLIVRGVMFPIAQKQFQSMAAMRKIQPKMKALQERFKDDKQRQQQEILKLYQAEKINPAAGCLPIVLQIPVFYALYKTLIVSVEMRHQPFIGWIRDLSAPDPLTPVNLFGLLHFSPPAYLAIGVLPLLVGATQYTSMKLNPQPMDPAQAQMFAIMPWVLVFIMAPFAAGLQLYWITNNLLTILQQWFLYRKFGLHLSDTHPVHT